jgi:ABC-2 type transport system permease protein
MHSPLHYLRLARAFARVGVLRKTQFRVEFLSQVAMDAMWYLVHVATFEILFTHTDQVAGWSHGEVRVFLGFLFVSDAFWMMWLGQSWHFGRELKDGALDTLRMRPGSPIFLYFFQRFSLEALVNASMAWAWLLYALHAHGDGLTPKVVGLLAWGTVLSCWCRTVLSVLYTIAEFFWVNSDLSNVAWEVSMSMADRPVEVFPTRFRQFLTSLVPIAALSSIPAALALGRIGVTEGLLHTAWLFALGLGVFRWWRASFRRYQSALG